MEERIDSITSTVRQAASLSKSMVNWTMTTLRASLPTQDNILFCTEYYELIIRFSLQSATKKIKKKRLKKSSKKNFRLRIRPALNQNLNYTVQQQPRSGSVALFIDILISSSFSEVVGTLTQAAAEKVLVHRKNKLRNCHPQLQLPRTESFFSSFFNLLLVSDTCADPERSVSRLQG